MSELRVIRAGIDTLEVSFSGQVTEEAADKLSVLKAAALKEPQPYHGSPAELMVLDRAFGFWSWRLVCPEFSIVLKRGNERSGATAQVRFSAYGLVNRSLSDLWFLAKLALSSLGDFKPLAVSRCDVCADFQGWTPTAEDLKGVVCPANYRATHGTESGVQTFQYGKGDAVLRIYDKTAELVVSGKLWLVDAWRQSDEWDESAPVWRAEGQLRRGALKLLGVDCVEQVIKEPGALLDYVLKWGNLRVPSGDQTKARWPEDPRWTALRKAVFGGVPLERRPVPSALMSLDRVKTAYIGAVATTAAYFGCDDWTEAQVRLSYAAEAHLQRENLDFAALVEDKRRRIIAHAD